MRAMLENPGGRPVSAYDKAELFFQKKRLRALARQIDGFYDRFDCGRKLADEISGEGRALREKFGRAYARVRELDPTAPPLVGRYALTEEA